MPLQFPLFRKNAIMFSGLALLIFGPSTAQALEDTFSQALDPAVWVSQTSLRGAKITCPVSDSLGKDGKVLELVYPGGSSARRTGPGWSTEVELTERTGYGAYQARLKPASSRSTEGVVSAFFTYYNDGIDYDGDGIGDNSEIDFEFLGAEPSIVYITVWTDYEVIDGVERFYHTARKVDISTGKVWQTAPGFEGEYGHLEPTTPLDWSQPGFVGSSAYRTYGFDWSETQVRFWMDLEDGAGPRELWRFQGLPGQEIPAIEAYPMINLWHNEYAWDTGQPARPPASAVNLRVDAVKLP